MAYFSNGTEGLWFEHQCLRCKYGQKPCPIAYIQFEYNYEAVKNPIATKILDHLVKNDGTCAIFEMAKIDFEIDPNQIKLF